MATPSFQHLPLHQRFSGKAELGRPPRLGPETAANRANYATHAGTIRGAATSHASTWNSLLDTRRKNKLPVIEEGIPILLRVDPNFDIDVLREKFAFEIVSEQEDGFVLVASKDLALTPFLNMVNAYATDTYGSATIASIHQLFDDPSQTERLQRVLSESLFKQWPTLKDSDQYIFDFGIECTGTKDIPDFPKRGKTDTDAKWAAKEAAWSQSRTEAYEAWDSIKESRESELLKFVTFYNGSILSIIDNAAYDAAKLPDSFTVRIQMNGKGMRDLILTYAFTFEVVEPDDIEQPVKIAQEAVDAEDEFELSPPPDDAPCVCIVDSGIQENHRFLEPAVDKATSYCFLPGKSAEVGDYVRPGGHGTRVAGAALYGEVISPAKVHQADFWLQNARILDEFCGLPVEMFPPSVLRMVIERFYFGSRRTRIFNHSINAVGPCRTRHMSAWAAEIDLISHSYDVLVIQSAGNIFPSSPAPLLGVSEHLSSHREHPKYLNEPSCRIANPGQSLQAVTVGSIAYGAFENDDYKTLAAGVDHPSGFSRSGFGIWNVIKPEVVEYGGDYFVSKTNRTDVSFGSGIMQSCPCLVRSTMYPPGPAVDRDAVGTSYAAPKVARIAGKLQAILPDESALLYRALIVQSARWPEWANKMPATDLTQVLRWIGYGMPSEERATTNDAFRATMIAGGDRSIKARECHIYQVPIPEVMRRSGSDFEIRIEVTLSYSAQPRRTRRNLRRYLSTWVGWKSSKLGESVSSFKGRALKDEKADEDAAPGTPLPWTLHESTASGVVRGAKRNAGTVQKDWALVKSFELPPEGFCIAVVGHPGWSNDPDSSARYALAVTFEVVGREIEIYDALRVAVNELGVEIENEIEAEVMVEE